MVLAGLFLRFERGETQLFVQHPLSFVKDQRFSGTEEERNTRTKKQNICFFTFVLSTVSKKIVIRSSSIALNNLIKALAWG